MSNQLASLRDITTVVADTGDIDAIKKYQPVDATTNPSLLLKAAGLPQYASLIDDAVAWAKLQSNDADQQLTDAADKLAVAIGKEISATIPKIPMMVPAAVIHGNKRDAGFDQTTGKKTTLAE